MNKSAIIVIALAGVVGLVQASHWGGHGFGHGGIDEFGHGINDIGYGGRFNHGILPYRNFRRFPLSRSGFRNGRVGLGGLNSNTHLGNSQFAQGSQGSLLGAGGRFVNEHDRDNHFNENQLHAQGGRNKDRTIIKEHDNTFGNIDAEGINAGNRQHDLQAGEGGILAAQGSQGSLANRQNLDHNLNAFGAGGAGSSGFNEIL